MFAARTLGFAPNALVSVTKSAAKLSVQLWSNGPKTGDDVCIGGDVSRDVIVSTPDIHVHPFSGGPGASDQDHRLIDFFYSLHVYFLADPTDD